MHACIKNRITNYITLGSALEYFYLRDWYLFILCTFILFCVTNGTIYKTQG